MEANARFVMAGWADAIDGGADTGVDLVPKIIGKTCGFMVW